MREDAFHIVDEIDCRQLRRIDEIAYESFGTLPGSDVSVATLCIRYFSHLKRHVHEVNISTIRNEIDAYHSRDALEAGFQAAKKEVEAWSQKLDLSIQTVSDRLQRLGHACRPRTSQAKRSQVIHEELKMWERVVRELEKFKKPKGFKSTEEGPWTAKFEAFWRSRADLQAWDLGAAHQNWDSARKRIRRRSR